MVGKGVIPKTQPLSSSLPNMHNNKREWTTRCCTLHSTRAGGLCHTYCCIPVVHRRCSNIDCMEELCTYYVHIQPCDNPAMRVSLFPFYKQDTEAPGGGPLAQGPRGQNGTARNAVCHPPNSEARKLSLKGSALALELPKVLSCAAQMLRAVGLQGLESGVLKEAEILQAKETLKGRQN